MTRGHGGTRRRPCGSHGVRRHWTLQGLTRDRHSVRCRPPRDLDQATAHRRALSGPGWDTGKPSKGPATVHRHEPCHRRPAKDHQGTRRAPEAAPMRAIRHSMGSDWPFWTLSGLVWVLYGSCLCPCLAMLGHDLSTPGPEGVQQSGPRSMPGTPAGGTSRQSWERRRSERRSCRGRVEQLWLRLWRHRSARGPQGEQREKASRVVGPA